MADDWVDITRLWSAFEEQILFGDPCQFRHRSRFTYGPDGERPDWTPGRAPDNPPRAPSTGVSA